LNPKAMQNPFPGVLSTAGEPDASAIRSLAVGLPNSIEAHVLIDVQEKVTDPPIFFKLQKRRETLGVSLTLHLREDKNKNLMDKSRKCALTKKNAFL